MEPAQEQIEAIAKCMFYQDTRQPYALGINNKLLYGCDDPTWEMVTDTTKVVPYISLLYRSKAKEILDLIQKLTDAR